MSGQVQLTFRQARASSLLSVRELAARAGVAPATVYLIEHGRTRPHPRTIRLLSAALGVEPTQITEFVHAIEEHGAGATEIRARSPRRKRPPAEFRVTSDAENTSAEQ